MAKKKHKRKKETHPTLFVLEGSIRHYYDGTMLELHSLITNDEWNEIVEETIKYKVFVECLKSIAFPILEERWDKEDDWFRIQLDVAVSRMRNIDPLLVANYDQDKIAEVYSEQMRTNAESMVEMIKAVREAKKHTLLEQLEGDCHATRVSDL